MQVEVFRRQDARRGSRVAQVLEGFVTRKVVKQTVMTVVYGVTRYGGRLQIEKRLRELSDFPQVCQTSALGPVLISLPFKNLMVSLPLEDQIVLPQTTGCLLWLGSLSLTAYQDPTPGPWASVALCSGRGGPLWATPEGSPPADHPLQEFLWDASQYLVRQVFRSLQEMFSGSRAIQVRPVVLSLLDWGSPTSWTVALA
ncbi:hypothetical protein P7K49_032687 [Saguinus oedipus]|uniref:DNA-directed RNA polymerase n=1 Tax=Saguinus oedipus TaxID=9490 RepID=A0ABQ9TPS1_SAGOE|nr:hypothetical protein P7K49_032687 [Saguinus oedipus]